MHSHVMWLNGGQCVCGEHDNTCACDPADHLATHILLRLTDAGTPPEIVTALGGIVFGICPHRIKDALQDHASAGRERVNGPSAEGKN